MSFDCINKEMENKDINININPDVKKEPIYTQIGKWIVSTISKAKWSAIFKVYFVVFFFLATALASFYAYNIVNNTEFVEATSKRFVSETEQNKLLKDRMKDDIRENVTTPQIQHDIAALMYSLDADRVFIFEMHNGRTNPSGLPFTFANMSYEVANRERSVDRCYKKFQDIPLTMYTYPEYMRKNKFFLGTADDIEEIDYDFAKSLKEEGGEFVGMIYMSGTMGPLGFLGISFHDINKIPNKDLIEIKLKSYGITIGELLDLQKQMEKENEKSI